MPMVSKKDQCSIRSCGRQKTSWVDFNGKFVEVCTYHAKKLGTAPTKVENIREWMREHGIDFGSS